MPDIDFGQISETLNNKTDRDLRNVDTTAKADAVVDYQEPTAGNNYTWYRKYKSGWVEQGGTINTGSDSVAYVSFPVAFSLTPQVFIGRPTNSSIPEDPINKRFIGISNVGLTGFNAWGNYAGFGSYWSACGKAAN